MAAKQAKVKTYILKYPVHNNIEFPKGTIVTITDDFWGKGGNDLNTGFTVAEGKFKGEKGCVANGLNEYLLDDNAKNRKLVEKFEGERKKLHNGITELNKKWDALPTSKLPYPTKK